MPAETSPLRVIQWGTGNAGRKALAGILRHPELELVGVHAHSPAKVGKDAAELCGWPTPTGVRATNDTAALLALDADCVCYMAQGETRIRETVEDLSRILEAGTRCARSPKAGRPGYKGSTVGIGACSMNMPC